MKKLANLFWAGLFLLASSAVYAQYCTVTNAGGTGTFMNVVALNTLNNNTAATNPAASPYYSSFAFGTNLVQGVTYPLSVTIGPAGTYTGAIVSVWIDWNQNLTYEASEWQQVGTNIAGGTTATINVTVPITAPVGNTGMRLRSRGSGNTNGAGDACTVMGSGETEDYVVTIVSTVGCSGTPTAGAAVAGTSPVCPSVPFNLTLNGATNASGMTYQWQSAPSTTGPWTNITGANGTVYQTSQLVDTWYQCIITCTSSGQSATSTPVQVLTNSFVNCYCTSAATSIADEEILNVSLSTLNNSSTCGVAAPGPGSVASLYSNFTTTVTPPILSPGVVYPFSVQIGTCNGNYNNWTKAWIDFNQNGLFTDPGEMVYSSTTFTNGPHVETGTVSVPTNAIQGITRMRVVNVETTLATSVNPCGTYTWGETEDYFVNVSAPPTCPQPTAPVLVSSSLNDAVIDWTPVGTETQWQVQYGPQGFALGTGTIVTVTAHPYTVPNLTPYSFYQAYVRAICSAGDSSYWTPAVSWNTYDQGQYIQFDNECPTTGFIDISANA